MLYHIDRFTKLGGAFIVHGWSSEFRPGDRLILTAGGVDLETVTRAIGRPDLPAYYGAGADGWGFRAYGIEDRGVPLLSTDIGLRFASGATLDRLAEASVPPEDHRAHMLWAEFVADANARGGRLLEIGSRARSGTTIRELFGPKIEYIGVDVAPGPNVDIVADAHQLSAAIDQPVDFICSISTFEHFVMPWKVALEANRILKPGGRIYSHSHQTWPEHDVPFDYFRFSENGWAGLYNVHTGFRIVQTRAGHPVTVSAVYNVGGPFEEMEFSPGHAMSVCVAEKTSDPLVEWSAPVSLIGEITYSY